jgi:parallel beta-helix repeat protein
MSRNGSGTYTLPAGNPVVTGTTISSAWANTTLTDIASALTNSLAADGQTTATGPLQMGNNKITGLAQGTLPTDGATVNQFSGATGSAQIGYNEGDTGAVTRTVQSKLQESISIKDFGAVCNGVANDTVAVQAAITAIGSNKVTLLIPGPTLVTTALTFGSNTELLFNESGMIIGTAGTELIQSQQQIIAGIHPIFSNCYPRTTVSQTVYPEWFGATRNGTTDDSGAFTKAFNFLQYTGGQILLQAGYYALASALILSYDKIAIKGVGNNISYLKSTGSNIYGLKIVGIPGTPIRNCYLCDFSMISETPGTSNVGLQLYFTAFTIVERMQIQDYNIGVYMEGATNTQLDTIGATYTGTHNNFIGFNVYGGTTATSANASSNFRRCYASGVSGLTGQIGFRCYGTYMSDVQFELCETALTNYGYSLDYTTAPNFNVDIIIRNPIVDRYFSQGIIVNGLPSNGALQIIGGYSNPDTLGSSAQNIYLSNCAGVTTIVGHEFMALSNTIYTDGVYMTGCSGVTVSGCIFTQLNKGIRAISSGYSIITGNVFMGGNPSSFSKMVEVIGGARVMVNGNSFSGATEAVTIDATSSGCGIVGNTANVATVGTRYTNAGSTPVGGADGSTGLNSGI